VLGLPVRKKRNFTATSEPRGKKKKKGPSKKPIFVIQKHAATQLHYDFRIEIDSVLKSWAVPKGISNKLSDKRLAIPTEDHPIEYEKFEGVIPEGHYGAGTVMVWDCGTYENIKKIAMRQCLKNGRIEVRLHGKKLKGAYALIRTGPPEKQFWLLLKMKDEHAGKKITGVTKSALSGRTMRQIAREG